VKGGRDGGGTRKTSVCQTDEERKIEREEKEEGKEEKETERKRKGKREKEREKVGERGKGLQDGWS